MCMLHMTFDQAADFFGWGSLILFSQHLPMDCATYRALNGKAYGFSTALNQSAILADIFDAIEGFNYSLAKSRGYRGGKPKRYPRPWASDNEQHFGKDPIPISEFDAWYYGGDE